MGGKIRCIITGAVDEGGFAPAHERQAHDVHARCGSHPSFVADPPLTIEHRDVGQE
jgi:hypothetical protein